MRKSLEVCRGKLKTLSIEFELSASFTIEEHVQRIEVKKKTEGT